MYLIELIFNTAGLQPQFGVLILLHPLDDLYHLMVVFSSDLTDLRQVDVVGNEALVNVAPQQRHNLVSVSKTIEDRALNKKNTKKKTRIRRA